MMLQLDDWVLCRIYKKNSSTQKPIPNLTNKEYTQYSNGSSSSSSSHIDDVLESLPEIDDRCFVLPRVNSLKTFQHDHDNKLNLQNLTAGNFVDWTNPAVLNSVTEFVNSGNQTQGMVNYGNDLCVPSVPTLCHVDSSVPQVKMEEEVQSGVRTQRVENSGFFQQGPNEFTQGQGFSNNFDLDGFRYPVHPVGFGLGH